MGNILMKTFRESFEIFCNVLNAYKVLFFCWILFSVVFDCFLEHENRLERMVMWTGYQQRLQSSGKQRGN